MNMCMGPWWANQDEAFCAWWQCDDVSTGAEANCKGKVKLHATTV
jgi:hypothetical protein